MAYALRYYKELIHEDGSAHRLEIHKKDSTAEAVEIGAVIQGLALEIQGSQGDVDSPIVKTSLSMTFVDAGDIEDGRKNGFWQEFYTPDALLWKVILKARTATETSFRTMWGGYVTPDSFSESLVYRGSVNIIARDNIGHMQDFPFDAVGDADGLISLRNLVEAGWEKIQSPMVLDWRGETESNMWLMCDGVPAPDTLMNVSQFEGMDWYKAIETALASYGIVMRYVGDNIVNVSSLRSMPLQGREVYDNLSQITPVFVAGAQRELVPAVRRIEESVSYDLQETLSMPKIDESAFTGDTQSYRCKIDGVDIGYGQFGTLEHDAPIWPIPNRDDKWSNVASSSLFFNVDAYEVGYFSSLRGLEEEIKRYMYIAANNVDTRYVWYAQSINCVDVGIRMKFGLPVSLNNLYQLEQNENFALWSIRYCISLEQDGNIVYYHGNGSWSTTYKELVQDYDPMSNESEFSVYVGMGDNVGPALMKFFIMNIEYAQTGPASKAVYGLYACVQDFAFTIPESASMREKNTVNTVYNAENNVILSRTPEIGPAYDAVALPGFIKNGIFYRSEGVILPARAWGWSGSTPQQMAVYNHLQLLCYYAKPNNLISGTIVNGDLTSGKAIYLWHGKEHLLVSGRYNLLNGMIEGAMLREFTRYEDMWGEVSETAFPDTEQDSTTNVEGGASSGGSSSTYTNTTTVNIGSGGGGGASYLNDLLDVNTDSVTVQSVLYFNGTEWVGRSLSTILNGYAKSADLLILSNLLASMWKIDSDGNLVTDKQVIIKNNLIVLGDTSSGGEGSASVGIQGIIVNGVTYRDTDGDGIIDLGEITGGGGTITEITSAMITSALGYTPYDASNPKGYITASALGGYATQSWVEGKGYITASALSGYITESAVNSKLAGYLPLAGGTITGNGAGLLTVNRQDGNPVIEFRYNGSLMGRYGFATDGTPIGVVGGSQVTLIHSGNIGSYNAGSATKLATARTIWGKSFDGTKDITGTLYLDNESPVWFKDKDGNNVAGLYVSSGNNMWLGYNNGTTIRTCIVGSDIRLFYGGSTSIGLLLSSSGNVGVGTVSPAYKLDVAGEIKASSVICGTTRLRVNASDNAGNFGYIKAETYNSNRGILRIGTNYGGSETITNAGVDVDAINIYRGVVGIGGTIASDTLYSKQGLGVSLFVSGATQVTGQLAVSSTYSADGTAGVAGVFIRNEGGIEISHASTPYIDFYLKNATADYSNRLICDTLGRLQVSNNFRVTGSTWLQGTVTIDSATTINGNLIVTGDISA